MTRPIDPHAGLLDETTLLGLRVDRQIELERCLFNLCEQRSNVFIYGRRGRGKTFLVRILDVELRARSARLPVQISALGLSGFGRQDPTSAFPEAVLLEILQCIWHPGEL